MIANFLKKIHREITPITEMDSFYVCERVKDYFDYPVHYHPDYELNFISRGKGVRRVIGDHIEEIGNTELVLVGPNLFHVWEQHNCTQKNIHEITIQFPENLFHESFLQRNLMQPIRNMLDRSAHGILFAPEDIRNIIPRLEKVTEMTGMPCFLELLSILHELAQTPNQRLLSTNTVSPDNTEQGDKVKLLYDYVHQNFSSRISLNDMAELMNMSNVSFNRFIKRSTGKTLVEYVNEVRVGYASRWLIEKDLSISEIAFSSGFNSIANFNRVFRKMKGQTPTDFRNEFSNLKKVL
ncbi:AraC family transcriptional regulator [Zeaxanthinibacter sp. PT1]|uniref:helix-turn-helix domain-containing protein n=1 Tax=Zeaxanthinibacter TaxID=561554 RepID=UPI00234A934F|nr:AraC family transcriptional regulator [Zeaxanthinibacter sp. PT1]MDC6352731.1 AraC family transcriptional regulator [Zeaxanthinibacter sp. PT1]